MGDSSIDEIKDFLVKKKNSQFKDYADSLNKNTKIKPISCKVKEAAEKSEFKVKTNTVIDDIIGGGIPEGKSTLLYGEFRTGKTQTCETCTVLTNGWVIYIDVEDSCRMERLREMCETRGINWEKVRDKIIYYQPKNWMEQMIVSTSLPSPADVDGKVDLIICDSLNKHFRGIEFQGRETLGLKTGLLREFISQLETASKMHKAALLYTSQVYDEPNAGGFPKPKEETQKPIGGHSLAHQPDFVLFFMKSTGNVRVVRMVDSSFNKLAERSFVITEKGIEDIPKDAAVAKQVLENAAKYEKKMTQEELKKEDKKKTGESEEQVKQLAEKLNVTPESQEEQPE
jgi:RecA/RadA recombinase